ncbi:MAG TPA: bifunctional diaminohydroxyphosphoribosylaminopyrimidine deaminase/5-amino-6-(5-phosphoribosylamino)uracil reductase RibD [Phycisphaerales bacterium]|nr:bifunctional diaminohydroxyphosphoribosylaminopyrimidine deaminase/5-amino-6-(5-phosphoribosylamino)uracil reductase RibD [Phycisphaerales bacterium]
MSEAKRMLDLAARAALRAAGHAEPNPLVGCVLVKDGRVLGIGHHRRYGGLHAEREALLSCQRQGNDPRGSTAYVTLEPCNGHGKQPPCSQALVEAGVARVVYARPDPNPPKSGGAMTLRQAGIACELSTDSPLASGLAAPFVKRLATGLPWTIAKWAQTIDGRIATRTGESKWISNERSRVRVHRLRGRVDAILTGIGTVLADDPLLTPRGVRARRVPKRVIADTDLDLPASSMLASTAKDTPTLLACEASLTTAEITKHRVAYLQSLGVQVIPIPTRPRAGSASGIDLAALLRVLAAEHQVATVMVEAGPGLLGSLVEEDLIDEAVIYIAPMLLGDELAKSVAVGRVAEQLKSARRFDLWCVRPVGGDVELTYRRREPAYP